MAVTKPTRGLGTAKNRAASPPPQDKSHLKVGSGLELPITLVGARPYERVAGDWMTRLHARLRGSGLTKTARQLILAWAGKEAESGHPQRLTAPQAARLVDCHRRTAERAMDTLEVGGWVRLVTAGSRAHRLASDYALVHDRLPRFGDRIHRKRTSEAAQSGLGRHISLPNKSAANRRPPKSLRTLKISKSFVQPPIASKAANTIEADSVPAGLKSRSPEITAAIKGITQELRAEGFAEVQLKRLTEDIAKGRRDAHQVQALIEACRHRWRQKEPKSRAGFFGRALQDAGMTRDLLRAMPRSAVVAAPTVGESAHLAQVSPALRGLPKFSEDYLKWQRFQAASPHADSPGFLDWVDQSQQLRKAVVQHAEHALGARASELQRQVKERLQRDLGSAKQDSDLWTRAFRHHYSALVLKECGLNGAESGPRKTPMMSSRNDRFRGLEGPYAGL